MALLSDRGCQRQSNEDLGRLVRPPSVLAMAEKGVLGVVADGMGGHEAGEVASEIAVDVVCRVYYETNAGPGESLAAALSAANTAILELATQDQRFSGMGTTCTAIALTNGFAYVAHVGDTRCYLIRNRAIYQITEDHSAVMALVRQGLLTAEQARNHPDRNLLERALGRRHNVEIAAWESPIPVQPGDHFALCSDGLSGVLSDEAIRDVILAHRPAEACSRLIELALQQNAPDNVTIGVIRADQASFENMDPVPETREVAAIGEDSGNGS